MDSKKDIIFCIFNYRNDENALVWYNRCKDLYTTFLMDTYHLDNGDAESFPIHGENILFYRNIYCGGLTIKAIELLKECDGKYLVIANSDVLCDDENFDVFCEEMRNVITENNIGVLDPSAKEGSMCEGCTCLIPENTHLYNQGTGRMRDVTLTEGWFEVIKREVCDEIYGHINPIDNKYGWGISEACDKISRKLGLRVVVDDKIVMYHPKGTGYDNKAAEKERQKFREKFSNIGINDNVSTLLCCIGRLENDYIREYVEYYKKIGVSNICLYDNNMDGEDDFNDVISDYIDSGFVILKDYRNIKEPCQLKAYTECYYEYKDTYDWFLFFDIDEFIMFSKNISIQEYLSYDCFRPYDMIHVNWLLFGDGGQTINDGRPLLQRIKMPLDVNSKTIYGFPDNFHIKSIVRGGLDELRWNDTPHTPSIKGDCCNGSGIKINKNSPFSPYDYRKSLILHFTTKTVSEFANKINRGFCDGNKTTKKEMAELFFRRNDVTKEKVKILKEKTGIDMGYLLPYEGDKRDDIKIYTLCYAKKSFKFLDDAVITPLQVGADNGVDVCKIKDNVGENISDKNYFYVENTGTYWIWKNVEAKYKGQMQYRRPLSGVCDTMNFDEIFKDYDVITCEPFYHPGHKEPTKEEPMFIPADTVEGGYAFSNCIDDLSILEMVIKMYHSEYSDDYDKYIKNGANLYYSNAFIMRNEDFDKYSEFLFDCLEKYLSFANINNEKELIEHVKYNLEVGKYIRYEKIGYTDADINWQCKIGGFLSERIWTLWLQHNFNQDRIYRLPYIKMEENMYT